MPRTSMRSLATAGAFMLLTCASLCALAEERHRFDVASQAMGKALNAFAAQAGINIYFDPADVQGLTGPALHLDATTDEALARLLQGTALRAVKVDDNTVRVFAEGRKPPLSSTAETGSPRLPQRTSPDMQPTSDETATSRVALEEVVVTAQKREERLQDVPVPVTAVSAESLVESNRLSLADYYTSIPGLSLSLDSLRGQVNVSIRGLTFNGASPSVGIVVDDVPYGSSTSLGGGNWMPDLDPSDLARIEVLRGPQGTLYGASSIGGLLKYVTVDPSTAALSGVVQASGSSVFHGDRAGYSARGAVNVPLSDTFAVRLSGFTREDPGYIDDPIHHEDGVNEVKAYGGFVAALWRPSSDLSLKVSALLQRTRRSGSADVDVGVGLGDLQNSYLPGTGEYDRKVEVYGVNLKAQLGPVALTSVTGFGRNRLMDSYDLSSFYLCCTFSQFGVNGTPLLEHSNTDKFTQELRLSTPLGPHVEWLLGAFYTHEHSPHDQALLAANENTGAIVGQWLYIDTPTTYEEFAAFTDVTVRFSDRFDVQIGARESRDRQKWNEVDSGPYVELFEGVASPNIYPGQSSTDNSFTYLFTPRWKLSDTMMAYARLASGYQPGGPNAGAPEGVPQTFGPSKARSYELGLKGDLFERQFSYDASVYDIQLTDVQLSLTNPNNGQGYLANGGSATSQGVELSVSARPWTGFSLEGWVSWNNAKLTEDFPQTTSAVIGFSGDCLPFSSRFSTNLAAQQEISLPRGLTGFAGGSVSYQSHRLGNFASIYADSPARQQYPGYARVDMRFGVKNEQWTVGAFVTNLTDRRGLILGGLDATPNTAYDYITPRTIGLTAAWRFR